MPRSPLAFALAALAALALVACGEEDAELLPGETAREITANLDTVKQLADEGDCVGAESAVEQVGEQVEAVQGVDLKLKRALEEGSARLEEVIAECEEAELEAIEPAIVPTEPEDEEEEEKEPRQKGGKDEQRQEGKGADTPSELPPQANGEGKGLEEDADDSEPPPSEEEGGGGEEPSGGLSPGAPAGEGE
jgi:hypothetical protein